MYKKNSSGLDSPLILFMYICSENFAMMTRTRWHIIRFIALVVCVLGCCTLSAHHRDSLTVSHIELVKNCGQWDEQVLYKASMHGGAVFAERECFTFVVLHPEQLKEFYAGKFNAEQAPSGIIDAAAYKVHFSGSNPDVEVSGRDVLSSYNNYYIGKNPDRWATRVPKYHEVFYENLYDGIDLLLTQNEMHLKYEFSIAPGVSPSNIKLDYEGIQNLFVSKGNLIISTSVAQIIELKPFAYQIDENGNQKSVPCNYKVSRRQLTFEVGEYDVTRPLIIDPVLIFSSYSGSTADNWGYTATYDQDGNLYSGGNVFDTGYPTVTGSYQVNFAGGSTDIAISKFDATGTYLHFSTHLGGSGTEVPHSLVVNANNELYVLGTTSSSDFPVTPGAFDTTFNGGVNYTLTSTVQFTQGSDIVIAKFSEDGANLLGSTFVGGNGNDGLNTVSVLRKNYADEARGEIIIDAQSNVYVASSTQSGNFPVTAGAFQTQHGGSTQDGCVIKLNHNLTNMIWCSYLGGSGNDAAYSLVLASDNSLYVCGGTTSPDLSTFPNVVQPSYAGGANDGFVAHISENGDRILQATYLGQSGYDQAYLVKNDRFDNPHIFGQTDASGTVWVNNAEWFVPNGGQFLTKLTPTLDSVIWSTAFGRGLGGLDISPTALLVDLCNNIYMSGWGSPTTNGGLGGTAGLPVTPDAFQLTTDNNDYYFICISDDASQLVYATFFGSPHAREHVDGGTSRFDNKGRIYQAVCAGCGGYDDFPTTQGAWSQENNSTNCNIGVIKFDFNLPAVVADFNVPNTVCAPVQMTFNNTSQRISDSTSFFWDFGDGATSTLENPTHWYTHSGTYTITLVAADAGSCNFSDTISREMVVLSNSNSDLPPLGVCNGDFVQIGIAPSGNASISYHWDPQDGLSNPFISNPIAAPDSTTTYQLFVTDGVCIDTMTQVVTVENMLVDAGSNRTVCLGESVTLSPNVTGTAIHYYWSDNRNFTSYINTNFTNPTIQVSPTQATTYYVRAEGAYCQAIDSVRVNVSHFTLSVPTNFEVCYGDSIQVAVEPDQQGQYHYVWSPAETVVFGQGGGRPWVLPSENTIYSVTATNEYGCTATIDVPVTIKRYTSNAVVADVSCYGAQNGSILLAVTGGEEPYYYQWSNGASQSSLSHVAAGTYSVIITDNTGCKGVDTFSIGQPLPLTVSLVDVQNVLCDQLCNGELTVQAAGGTAPYNYAWLHGATGDHVTGLCAGAYTVNVMDGHNCEVTGLFQVQDTAGHQLPYQLSQISCFGDCDGAIYLEPDFGAYGYQVSWQHDATLTTDSATHLCAGEYVTEVLVDDGCRYQLYLQIDAAEPLSILNLFATTPLCFGDANATLHIDVSGGSAPYQYFLNGQPASSEITDLFAGMYTLLIEDANACQIDTNFIIEIPQPLILSESHFSPPCVEVCIGEINLDVAGGTIPYRYNWSNGLTTQNATSLCVGTYTVTVTDRHNCQITMTFELADSTVFPSAVEAWSDVDTIYSGQNTQLHATDLGGDFSYQWTPSGSVEQPNAINTTATPLTTTDYVLIVSDRYGCIKTDTVPIFVMDVICEEPYVFIPNAFSPNDDGLNDVLYVRGEVVQEIVLKIFDRWGEEVFQTTDYTQGWDGTFRGEKCEPGVYDYYLQVVCIGQKRYVKKGNVTLLR